MKKIKILHVTYDMAIGGTEQVIRQLVENTDKDKFDVSILCLEDNIGDIGQTLIKQGIEINTLNRHEGFDFALLRSLRKYIQTNNIDILHCHQYTPYSYGILASLLTKSKVIFTEHGRFYPDSSSWKRRFINPVLSILTYQTTSISRATKQALIDYEFLSANKIKVIYNGIVDLSCKGNNAEELREGLGLSPEALVLGTISRLDPIKNHRMILTSFQKILREIPTSKLLIIGDGELRKELEQQCHALDIVNHVIFTGFISDPQRYLQVMDIFLLPSFSEGSSMTLLEAMSFSRPCIVTNVGGNPEIVLDNETGIVIENDQCDELTTACLTLLRDKQKRTYLGANGRKRYEELFTVEKMIAEFEALYIN